MIAPQPRGSRQLVRYAPPARASLPTSRDPACAHHLASSHHRINPDASCLQKNESTYGRINKCAFSEWGNQVPIGSSAMRCASFSVKPAPLRPNEGGGGTLRSMRIVRAFATIEDHCCAVWSILWGGL